MFFVFRCQPSKLYLQSCHQSQENLQTAKRWALLGELNWKKKTNTFFFSGHLFGMFGTTPKICQEYQEDLDASPCFKSSSGASPKLLRHRTWRCRSFISIAVSRAVFLRFGGWWTNPNHMGNAWVSPAYNQPELLCSWEKVCSCCSFCSSKMAAPPPHQK